MELTMIERTQELRSKLWASEIAASIGTAITTIGFSDGTNVIIDSGSAIVVLQESNSLVKIVNYGTQKIWIIDLTLVSKVTYNIN